MVEAQTADCLIIPGIGIGANGIPIPVCAKVTLTTFKQFLDENPMSPIRIKIVDMNIEYIEKVNSLLKSFSFEKPPFPQNKDPFGVQLDPEKKDSLEMFPCLQNEDSTRPDILSEADSCKAEPFKEPFLILGVSIKKVHAEALGKIAHSC